MVSPKKWIHLIVVASLLAISILGTTVADVVDKENEAIALSKSTILREWQFTLTHTVHHYAMISAMLKYLNYSLTNTLLYSYQVMTKVS